MKLEGEESYQEILKHMKSVFLKLKDKAQYRDNTYHEHVFNS